MKTTRKVTYRVERNYLGRGWVVDFETTKMKEVEDFLKECTEMWWSKRSIRVYKVVTELTRLKID